MTATPPTTDRPGWSGRLEQVLTARHNEPVVVTVGWSLRVVALAVIGISVFAGSPADADLRTAQMAMFALGAILVAVRTVAVWRRPGLAAAPRPESAAAVAAQLALMACCVAGCTSPHGDGLVGFGLIAALAAGAELALATASAVAGTGVLAIVVGAVVFDAGIGAALGYSIAVIAALLAGNTARSYRMQAEQSALMLTQIEALRSEQRQVAVLDERTRIAREIHDVLAHSLGALSIQIQSARVLLSDQGDIPRSLLLLDRAQRMTTDGLAETRRAVHALRADTLPLGDELARLADTHTHRHDTTVHLSIGGTVRGLAPDAVLTLLRTAQESLVNAAKHAPGQPIGIDLTYHPGMTALVVTNPLEQLTESRRGGGDPPAPGVAGLSTVDGGYGLQGMRERLLLLGGTLSHGRDTGQWIVTAQVPR